MSPNEIVSNVEFRHSTWPRPRHAIKQVTFRNVGLSKTLITRVTFNQCLFEDCLFVGTRFKEVEFHNCRFVYCTFYKVRFERTYLDPAGVSFGPRYRTDASNAVVGFFQALLSNYAAERQEDFFAEADIRFRRWKRFQLAYDEQRGKVPKWQARWRRATSLIYEGVAGFGYRPGRFFGITVALFLLVSALNHESLGPDVVVVGHQPSPAGWIDTIFYNFSVLTVLGFSTVVPTTPLAKIVTVGEALASIGWLGIYGVARQKVSQVRRSLPAGRPARSEAVFGSHARGDADRLSDRDVLIVDEDADILRARGMELAAAGWSVASYTFRKLEAIASKGALFVQHLALEAEIRRDEGGRLGDVLARFRPKKSYKQELLLNGRLAHLVAHFPDCARGELWAADVLYVALRNFGILWLADRGVYRFAYEDVLDALAERRALDRAALPDLVRLRFAKCLHRGRERLAPERASGIVQRALEALPRGHFPDRTVALAPHRLLAIPAPVAEGADYLVLRDLERRLIATTRGSNGVVRNERLVALRRWVLGPASLRGNRDSPGPGALRTDGRHTISRSGGEPPSRKRHGQSARRLGGMTSPPNGRATRHLGGRPARPSR